MKFLLLSLLFSANLLAIQQEPHFVVKDSTIVEQRSFSNERLEKFRSDPEFNYEHQSFSSISLIDVFLSWLWNNFFKYLLNPGTSSFWEVLIYLFAFGTLFYLVRQFMKNKLGSLFYKPEKESASISAISEDNIHDADLNKLLEQEIQNNRFRNAVRLLYLISLKLLSDKNFINWKIGKTNYDYYSEIKNDSLKTPFSGLTRLYEYAWYGEFEITEDSFSAISGYFENFNNLCGQTE
ncbi:MAG: DUF4129 domain-containing protein [Calditrichaeota bacterium]|nr:MAG: DUF4129 domain-containing protein [Calditrichota bacterium]MBL1205374.1 DUF4129 domain-containing protein [Calditrichota bacterium]NOG45203.1 DUF4129 domain-containing protein [Calditrichota bacterium]